MVELRFPRGVKRNPGYWLNVANGWRSRRKFLRRDNSNAWRESFLGVTLPRYPQRSVPFSDLLADPGRVSQRFRIVILGDSGEGDQSQYGLVPLIRALDPQWMILNGDVAYPAGREQDFDRGFFRPYRGLECPIWALPGNHEYYSSDKGRTFFQIFCTYRYAQHWADHGLSLVPQPGTYWEVKERGGGPPLTVIGLDTGMKGNLDGSGWGKNADRAQHSWLRARLERAEAEKRIAIVLFHIPALVDERHKSEVHLGELHRILAASPAVRLVVCGHIHNHQYYDPKTFARYLDSEQGTSAAKPPHYVVTGGGGAYLSEPRTAGRYPAEFYFPDAGQWRKHAKLAEKFVASTGLARAAAGRVASIVSAAHRADEDSAKLMSLLVVDVSPEKIEARHVLMPDLSELYPSGTVVDVARAAPRITDAMVDGLLNDDGSVQRRVLKLWP